MSPEYLSSTSKEICCGSMTMCMRQVVQLKAQVPHSAAILTLFTNPSRLAFKLLTQLSSNNYKQTLVKRKSFQLRGVLRILARLEWQQQQLLLESIQSTMNQLYHHVQQILKKYSHQALLVLFQNLTAHPGQPASGNFNCAANQQYVIKRLINAALSRESDIKFNAYFSLSAIVKYFPTILASLNSNNVYEFITTQADLKQCGGKVTQIQAYTSGKILIIKALFPLFKDNIQAINSILALGSEYPQLEEQSIELASQLVVGKKSLLAFSKCSPTTNPGFILFSILRSKLKKQQFQINESAINQVLTELTFHYPRRSICLSYIGAQLIRVLENPAKYLQSRFELAFGDESDELNFRQIFYILQILQSYLKNLQITSQNVLKCLSPGLVGFWLSQLKVQNKKIRKLAESISIHFEQNKELALNVLKQLHISHINLSNLNIKHPLYPLYQIVQPGIYFEYLMQLCSPDTSSIETEEDSSNTPIDQFQMFVMLVNQELKAEQISKAVQLFVNKYHANKTESNLQALTALFNSLIPTQKRRQKLNTKSSLILAKLNFESLQLGETLEQVKGAIKEIRSHCKTAKQQENPFIINFTNFLLAVGFYFLVYPEEVEIYSDLQAAFEDIKTNFVSQQQGIAPKKKRKLNPQDEKSKPIHVLVDVFISLLTKSPQFLRTAVNSLFEEIIPFLDTQDLSHLLQVIQRPDQEYIQQIQND